MPLLVVTAEFDLWSGGGDPTATSLVESRPDGRLSTSTSREIYAHRQRVEAVLPTHPSLDH